jgi:hypothetical protein
MFGMPIPIPLSFGLGSPGAFHRRVGALSDPVPRRGMESAIEALTVFLAMISVGFVSFMDVFLFGGIV